jgi:hypothetical protein
VTCSVHNEDIVIMVSSPVVDRLCALKIIGFTVSKWREVLGVFLELYNLEKKI